MGELQGDVICWMSYKNMEELVKAMMVGGSLCCDDYEMVEFKISRGGSKAKGRITELWERKLCPVQEPACEIPMGCTSGERTSRTSS